MSKDAYAVSASIYDLLNASLHPGRVAALERLTPLVRAESGPVLDIRAGSSLNTVSALEHLPETCVHTLEPSTAMRVLILTKVAAYLKWSGRVTTRPEAFGIAPLPDAVDMTILLGALGHLSPDERAALFVTLTAQLPGGGAALTGLQPPYRPVWAEPYGVAGARIGDLTYSGPAKGWLLGDEHMQWGATCRAFDDDRVLAEETTEYLFHHPDPEVIRTGFHTIGLSLDQIEDTTFYLTIED